MMIKVKHCSNCPVGEGWYKESTGFSGYYCNAKSEKRCVIYTDSDPDEIEPDHCPLNQGDLVITRANVPIV